jgi:hypothetical protein
LEEAWEVECLAWEAVCLVCNKVLVKWPGSKDSNSGPLEASEEPVPLELVAIKTRVLRAIQMELPLLEQE